MPTLLQEYFDRLVAFPPTTFPVLSLYLNAEPDQHGQDDVDRFLRRELTARGRTYEPHSADRESYDRDVERIQTWVQENLRPSANGVAIFACAGQDDFFEAVQLDAPIKEHRLYVYNQPQLYELARITDAYPGYAAVVLDSQLARIFVFALGGTVGVAKVEGEPVKGHQAGGWSQARYQRHVDNVRQQHVKDTVAALDRIVREEDIGYIVLAGDEVIVPLFREELPQHLEEKLVEDVLRLDSDRLASTQPAGQASPAAVPRGSGRPSGPNGWAKPNATGVGPLASSWARRSTASPIVTMCPDGTHHKAT